jgi:Domain of unknown function (DUF4190)
MPSTPPAESIPPIEPVPVVQPAGPVAPPPPIPPVAPPVPDPYSATPPPAYAPAYAPASQGAYQGTYYGAPQPPKGLAIASMVLGIAGVFFSLWYGLGLFPSIAAIITGHMAQKRQPHAKGFWIAGLVTGYVGLLLSLIGVGLLVVVIVVATNATNNLPTY